jgi:hypothetical protein
MRSLEFSVLPKDGESSVPVALAGKVMVSVQSLFTHIGEYVLVKELRILETVDARLASIFDLTMNRTSGVSIGSSVKFSTSGIIEDAMLLFERTLISMGSGAGGYWIEDTFSDPRYRKLIADDVIELASVLRDHRFYVKFSAEAVFDIEDIEKIQLYINNLGMSCDGAVCGIVHSVRSRSGRGDKVGLACGSGNARLSFADPALEKEAFGLSDRAVIVAGKVTYSGSTPSEVSGVGKIVPLDSMKFRRIISADGDIVLNRPVHVTVAWSDGNWTLKNSDLGVSVKKEHWDEAVVAFHDQFMFLWNEYSELKDGMSGEEKEVHDYLASLMEEE